MLATLSSLTYSICSSFPQGIASAYQKTTEVVEKVANSVFEQVTKLHLADSAPFPVGLAAVSFLYLYSGGAQANFKLTAFGISALAINILYLKAALNKSGAISQLDKAINALGKALDSLTRLKKNPQEIKETLKAVFGQDALNLPNDSFQFALVIQSNLDQFLKRQEMLKIGPLMMAAMGAGAYFLGRHRPD